jgi:hypothetical protein
MGSHKVHMSSTSWVETPLKTYMFVKTRLLGLAGSKPSFSGLIQLSLIA